MNESPPTMDWSARAERLRPEVLPWIGGMRVTPDCDAQFSSLNPATGGMVAELPACGEREIDAAVAAARRAFVRGDWSRLSPRERMRRLYAFAEALDRRADELALLDTLEMGMPIGLAGPDLRGAIDILRATVEAADKLIDEVIPNHPSTLLLNVHEPVGVVAAITPWNFPAYIAITKIAPALAVGNSVVLKPSEIASLSCLLLGEIAAEAGIPEGVLNVVPGLGQEAGAALARHRDVDLLTFTGSTVTGRRLLEYAGQSNMKRLILECGGKSPHLVFDDVADLDAAADAIVAGITFNSGQVCVAGSRVLVHRAVHADLLGRLLERASAIRAGNPLDESTSFGPLASAAQFARVQDYVASGVAEGAALVVDGAQAPPAPGCYWMPTLFDGVRPDMRIAREEIFGPVLGVTPFEDEDEALRLANATDYGLVATVWTRDAGRGLRLSRGIRAGSVSIIAGPVAGTVDATAGAFEPHGQSGTGVEGGLAGMRAFTRRKAVALSA